jgi:hypothetical protein
MKTTPQTNTQHTPGPWKVREEYIHQIIGTDGWGAVADCAIGVRTPEEKDANARLIAAAPDLLAIAEAFVVDYAPNAGELAKWRGRFRDAIRKAQGGA